MKNNTVHEMLAVAEECARQAGETCRERLSQTLDVSFKTSHADIVTEVDTEVERLVSRRIRERFPDHGILGEEGTGESDLRPFHTIWIIDPIDGTINFVQHGLNYAISIGVYRKGEGMVAGVIYDPSRDEMFTAIKREGAYLNGRRLDIRNDVPLKEAVISTGCFWSERARQKGFARVVETLAPECRGLRVLGSAAMELAYVACGRLSAYMTLFLHPWDCAAGLLLVEEAGGNVSRINGAEFDVLEKGTLLAANEHVYENVVTHTKTMNV